jgi:MurNAc alpha-1-phosphate uridylyltransferase|tara:strand:+ start:460 stop:1164 length:705 start_codon:yes stop_codon:yes gene_type:complete
MSQNVKSAIILAAGFGKRMRHLTHEVPKPLINFKGKPLIQYSIDFLESLNVQEIVINVHYKSDQIKEFVRSLNNSKIKISDESSEILDTGGGVKKAMGLINGTNSIVINSDVLWNEEQASSLKEMDSMFVQNSCDSLLCLSPLKNTKGYKGEGDFVFLNNNKIRRHQNNDQSPFVYCGAQIISIDSFIDFEEDIFSINKIWNRSISNDRLMGFKNNNDVFHIGSVETLDRFNEK